MTRLLLTFFFLCVVTPLHAEDYKLLFEDAVEAVDWELEKNWAFTESTLTDGKRWVGKHDPRNNEVDHWTLISVDGRKPNEDELREFAHKKEEHETSDSSQRVNIVDVETIELLEETEEYWLLNFIPDEDEVEFISNVDATVKISKDGRYLEAIDLRNNADIKPGFGTTISTFIMHFQFGPAIEGGPIVPRNMAIKAKGRALLFIGFDETEIIEYSNFEFAGSGNDL
ncbi:MAG: hypothetical protein GQ577_04245 [Woeseiaceae bacterium]|nr:hypothetical protein [Woeseiaceae bacterium]